MEDTGFIRTGQDERSFLTMKQQSRIRRYSNIFLQEFNYIPGGLLDTHARDLHEVLYGPSLIQLTGRETRPIAISVLLNGDDDTGLQALQQVLKRYANQLLPRSLLIFIANVDAAKFAVPHLNGQGDYQQLFANTDTDLDNPEAEVVAKARQVMFSRKPLLHVQLHRCATTSRDVVVIPELDATSLKFAQYFSRHIVVSPEDFNTAQAPKIPQMAAYAGSKDNEDAADRLEELLDTLIHWHQILDIDADPELFNLYEIAASVQLPEDMSFGFGSAQTNVRFIEDLEDYSFVHTQKGLTIGFVKENEQARFLIEHREHQDAHSFLLVEKNEIKLNSSLTPAFVNMTETRIRQKSLFKLLKPIKSKVA